MYIYKTKLTPDVFLQSADNVLAKKYIDEINVSCDTFRGTPIPSLKLSKFRLFDEIGERAIYQQDYFARRRRLSMFFLRTWLYKEKDDIKELEDMLWSVCDEYTWALPAHLSGILADENMTPHKVDLFAAETAHTISEAISLCGTLLHPAVVRRCIDEVFRRVIAPFESADRDKYGLWWETAPENWSAVCGGAVGMAALYCIEDEARLMKILSRAKAACNCFIASCADDGVCKEGISYWMYAMQYYVAFDALMQERMGKSIIDNAEKIENLAAFPAVACMANHHVIKFSDCSETLLFFGILCKLHETYGVAIPEQSYYPFVIDRCARTCGAVRTIAWFNPELTHSDTNAEDVFLPQGQWAVLHGADMTAVVKGGNNDEPHNHNDIGSFMCIKGKDILADELGAAKYTKTYFMKEVRYSFFNAGSQGHSLPIVNGRTQEGGAKYAADAFEKTDDGIRISFAGAYGKEAGLEKLVRDVSLDEKGMQIKDSFVFCKNGNTAVERIITKQEAEVLDAKSISLSENGKTIGTITFLAEGEITVSKESYFVPNSAERNDIYSPEDFAQSVTVIDFACTTDADTMEISYRIK